MAEEVSAVTSFTREMVDASKVCGCSSLPECSSDDTAGCRCEDPDYCLAGVRHVSMEARS